jgi:hypothetical protein
VAKSPTLKRGFKAASQRTSAQQRELLGLRASAPLDPRRLAGQHGVRIKVPQDVPSLHPGDLDELTVAGKNAWSAVSIPMPGGHVIVLNPTHDQGRTNNSICHELSHILLDHDHGKLESVGDCLMREFDQTQEDEADWLAGSLLAPDAALRSARFRGWDNAQTAMYLGASEDLVRWRRGMSGVDRYVRPARSS